MKKLRCCNNCGNEYEYERATSTYCSDECRVDAWKKNNDILDTLYINYEGKDYRIQVTEFTVWVENKTDNASKIPFTRELHWIYNHNRKVWFYSTISELLDEFEQLRLAD